MRTFCCDGCGSLVFFDNVKCVKCGLALGFLPSTCELRSLEPSEDDTWRPLAPGQSDQLYRVCNNSKQYEVCNWMVEANDPDPFCVACRFNDLIPNLSMPGNLDRWHKVEMAKRRIIYTILRLGLPTDAVPEQNRPALRFNFVGDLDLGLSLLTGHNNGVITINIAESDDAERERRRVLLREPYRTLLGHLRHEVAHYYWDRLIANSHWLPGFRKLFGDETADYAGALAQYYQQGSPPDWQVRHVSAYAGAHPWEDWAESWAHYMHIMDMVETAGSFGMILQPNHPAASSITVNPPDAFDINIRFDAVLEYWFPLTYALNSLNRGMGLLDVYPFALSYQAIRKLHFVHEVVQSIRSRTEVPAI